MSVAARINGQANGNQGVQHVVAPLNFITPQAEKPAFYSQAYTGGEPVFGFAVEDHDVLIADVRPHADAFSLDHEGFSLRKAPSAVADFYDDAEIASRYAAEVTQLVSDELGASEVHIFDVTRRSDSAAGAKNRDGHRGAATRIHVDYTETSALKRAGDVLGEDRVEALLRDGRRIVQVNVWRPIKGPVQRSPLALADASSVAPADLVATDQVFPDRVGEIYHLAHNTGQRWYYAPLMGADEVFFIKGWDSDGEGRAQFTPHTAFRLPSETDDTPARESIEVRTFALI